MRASSGNRYLAPVNPHYQSRYPTVAAQLRLVLYLMPSQRHSLQPAYASIFTSPEGTSPLYSNSLYPFPFYENSIFILHQILPKSANISISTFYRSCGCWMSRTSATCIHHLFPGIRSPNFQKHSCAAGTPKTRKFLCDFLHLKTATETTPVFPAPKDIQI